GGLGHAGQHALMAEQTQGVAADAELAQVGAAAAGDLAAVAHARGRAVGRQHRQRGTGLHALLERELEVLRAGAQRLARGTVLVDQLLALEVLVDERGLGHGVLCYFASIWMGAWGRATLAASGLFSRKGMFSAFSRSNDISSVEFLMQMVMFRPW